MTAASPSSAPVKPGDVLAGKYRVDRILGEGGMGVVVAATHAHLGQRVALKFLLPELANRPDILARFDREARAAVKIQSEHVARVLDMGVLETGAPYMVMEYLEGGDLAQVVRQRGHLEGPEAVEYILQACEALAEAHVAGIVHRDLKPATPGRPGGRGPGRRRPAGHGAASRLLRSGCPPPSCARPPAGNAPARHARWRLRPGWRPRGAPAALQGPPVPAPRRGPAPGARLRPRPAARPAIERAAPLDHRPHHPRRLARARDGWLRILRLSGAAAQ